MGKPVKPWEALLPDKSLDIHEENLFMFFQTMFERQEIWYKRFKGESKPWTSDEILRDSKFTNVYRELDRGSQYLISNLFLRPDVTIEEIVFGILLYRVYNQSSTFGTRGIPSYEDFNEADFLKYLGGLESSGKKTLNDSAYKINTYIWPGFPRWAAYTTHIVGVYYDNFEQIFNNIQQAKNIEEVLKQLRIYGVGTFLSHEYYQDLTYISRYTEFNDYFKFDQNDYTNPGPGAIVGLALTTPQMSINYTKQVEGIKFLRDISKEYLKEIGEFKYLNWDKKKQKYFVTPGEGDLTLHQIEMWLCEFQKYWKMQNKVGKQRSKITPGEGRDYEFYLY